MTISLLSRSTRVLAPLLLLGGLALAAPASSATATSDTDTATATVASAAAPASSSAAAPTRYFITIAGSCDYGNNVYDGVDFRGGVVKKVFYPATAPPLCGELGFQQSVDQGVVNARNVLEDTARQDPAGEYVLVGYSQGAEVASLLMEQIADGRTSVAPTQVKAKLYADPMQPVTGLGAAIPKGVGVPGINFISPGPGRTDYNGIQFLRYCIESDGVCDNRNPFESLGGYFAQHSCYGVGRVFDTIADGVYSNQSHFWPRQNCRPPFPTL